METPTIAAFRNPIRTEANRLLGLMDKHRTAHGCGGVRCPVDRAINAAFVLLDNADGAARGVPERCVYLHGR